MYTYEDGSFYQDPDQPIFIRADDMEDTDWILDGATPGSGVDSESTAKPDGSIDIASQLDRWTMTETAGELTKTHVLGVNSDTGRVEMESHTIRDGAGNILREDAREQGGIEFFDSESAPVWPFDLNGSSERCDA